VIVGDFNIGRIDEVIHGRIRLGIMAYLIAADIADFNTLKNALETNDGTLSVQLRKLEAAGYVAINKSFQDRRPLTQAKLTAKGRQAFRRYLDAIADLARLQEK
jgi:DNA-binding MarR family transcriptional regulator